MAYKSYPFKTRLDLIKKIEEDSVKVVEDEEGKKVNQAPTTRLDDIAPVRKSYPTTTTTKKTTTSSKKKKDTWFSSGAFSDGYDFGDLTKTILGTTGDVVTGVTKGVFGLGEGIGDAVTYGVAGISDALGKDRFADDLRASASESITDKIFKPAEDLYDKYSFLGERSDNITQGLGYMGGIMATGGIGASAGLGSVGTTILTSGVTGASSFGSGASEAYQGGATDEEAYRYGLIAGAGDAITELFFGGLGRSVNALGLSKGLSSADDMLAKAVSNKFKTQLAKNLSEYTVKAGAEGLEEVMAGLVQGIGKKVTYMSEEELGKILADEQLLDQFIMGAVTSGIAQAPGLIKTTSAGRDYVSGYTQNEQSVIDKEVQNRIGDKKLTNKEISKITDEVKADFEKGYISTDTIESVLGGDTYTQLQSIRDNKTSLEQEISELENKPYAEMTVKENERLKALREELSSVDTNTLENQLQSEMGQKIANDGYLQRSYQEKANRGQNFTYDTTKITNENEKAVYESAAKFMNNTNRSHEFVEKVAKIAKDKGTNYGFINNEELKSLGHNVDGKQVNGLVRTTQDGKQTVLINVDSAKALNTIVGHETTHLLEGTTEYQELQEALFNYAKTKGDFDTRQASLNELYEGIEGADVNSELTADLVGDYLFTDADFINSLSTQKPTVFQKIKDLIDDLVVRFKGTKEEKQLREVQKKFKEAYKQNVASKETNTQYSFAGVKGAKNNQKVLSRLDAAQQLEQKGTKNEDIRQQTGWFKGTDGKWRIEISDRDSRIIQKVKPNGTYKLGEVLKHDKLYEAYPELKNYKIKFKESKNNGGFNHLTNTISINNKLANDLVSLRGTLMHEVQHAIQKREGFARGTYYDEKNAENYKNSAGEQEARDVRNRLNYSKEQVKNIAPVMSKPNSNRLHEVGLLSKKVEADQSIKYSLTDNQGRTLSKEQQEYFKDSKVRDESGNLLTMYHGTNNDFTIFDKSFIGKNTNNEGIFGKGFYFTEKRSLADGYNRKDGKVAKDGSGQTMELYLDMKNPFYWNDIDTKEKMEAFIEETGMPKYVVRWNNTLKNQMAPITDIKAERKFSEVLQKNGYDGVIYKYDNAVGEYVVFNSNQIKNIDNTNPTSNADIRYSLSDNTGRNLSEYTLEKTKNSKIRDEKGNLMLMYHGSPDGNYDQLKAGTYFTSDRKYAERYTSTSASSLGNGKKTTNNPKIYEAYLNIEKPFDLNDPEARNIYINDYVKGGNALGINPYLSDAEYNKIDNIDWTEVEDLKDFLQENGYDYDGIIADEGGDFDTDGNVSLRGKSYIPFSEEQIIKANEDNTKYSLTPDYGMQHRPSTDYGDASNFEENMPDVFEHPEWYMFGGDGWYKKAYKESWNALKKVRNNPDGEITIYRATIGDTFNEGDWVSPSKAYAEWHNYSNLEGKGKVIELKVKAKDIRFAGDDLNEFGYFPNGVDDYSLSRFNEQRAEAKGNYNVYGEDVKLQQTIAPLQEEIQTLTETVQELKEQIAPVQESPVLTEKSPVISGQEVEYTQPTKAELDNLMALQKTGGTEYANTFFGLRDKYGQPKLYKGINEYKKAPDTYEAPIKGDEFAPTPQNIVEQQREEAFNNIDDVNMPMETEDIAPDLDYEMTSSKSLFETRDYEEVGNRKVNAYQYDNPEVKPFFQEEAQAMLGDLKGSIKGERNYNDDLYYATGGEQGFYGTERQTTTDIAELLDGVDGKYKYTYADIEKGLNAIINDKGSENNAVSKRIEFYLDKRLREGYTTVDGIEVPSNQDYIKMMAIKDMDNYYNSLIRTDEDAPVENVENHVENVSNSKEIAPVKEKYEAIKPKAKIEKNELGYIPKDPTKESTYDDIAEVLVEEPKTESDRNKRKWAIFKANVFDKGIVFEDLALKNNNRELMGKWDYTLTSEARGQYVIGNGHNGASKSLNDIRSEVESTGLTKDFYNYMYHKHNVDRMSLATRFEGMENKPVFGESVTAEQSQAIVNQYEKTHPEFLDFAQDVYDYVNADKQVLIDKGVISQETADLWSEMYPHYVPTRRTTDTGIDINVPLDTGRTGINAPIKKATGGSSDILPLFDTMAMRTLQTYRATAKNSFGVELMNTLGTTVESNQTNVDEVIDSIDAQEGLLQEGKKGKKPTFTVFENGEKVTFEITKDMYDALKPLNESSLLSKTVKPLNAIGNLRRGLLTEYNPTFLLTNAIKDTQDILINSQHATKTYSKIPEAHKQLLSKGYWYQEYVANGGERNSYFDNETNSFKTEDKGVSKITDLPPLKAISNLNNHIEMIPRLAEYIASREAGRSIEVSMLDAARVTTNFKAGGAVTKWANRNGATFLNASVQGAMQQVRNIREAKANGVKGWVNLATKFAIAGLPAILLNNLVWDDDEEYDDLSDYVKQNYYVIGKTDDGTFIRIPKGRTVAVIQEGINQMSNLITGDDEADLKTFIDLTINNLAPNNPLDNNVLSPIIQVANNEAWYGGDLVPTRLQNLPETQQYDESTDVLSRWLGEIFDYSPYKINYLIDQYSGGLGDVLLPMMTPEAESGADSLTDQLIAPIKDKFTTSSTFNNQNVTDFYDLKEKLLINSNKENASDKDVLQNKYINSVNGELSELYKQKREIQNSNLSNSEKYKQAKEVQEQINALAKNALSEYTNISSYSNYSTVGDREYYKRINSEGEVEWTKVDNEEAEDLNNLNMTNDDKNVYFATKTEISGIVSKTDDADEKKSGIIDSLLSVDMDDDQKAYLYGKYYSSDETLEKVTDSGISFDDYLTFHKDTLSIEGTEPKVEYLYNSDYTSEAKTVIYETSVLSGFDNEDKYKDYKTAKAAGIDIDSWLSYKKQEFVADKDSSGNSISGSRKDKIISYINSLDLSIPQKAILIRQEYKTYTKYNNQIVSYVGGLDISYEEKVDILEGLDMTVDDDGNVFWK